MSAWSRMSQSIRATSDHIEGPYTRAETVIGTESHNTLYAYSAPDKMHLIFTIFGGASPESCNPYLQCTNGSTPGGVGLHPPRGWAPKNCPRSIRNPIHYSESLEGPFRSNGGIVVSYGKHARPPASAAQPGLSNPGRFPPLFLHF